MKQYLGLDSSTQGLKAILIDEREIVAEESVNFGNDLPQYHSPNGFLPHEDPETVHADPLMWLDALDLLFAKLQKRGIALDRVCGISGSAQQHGSVYLNGSFPNALAALVPSQSLAQQLKNTLSRPSAPIWMDHSTTSQCQALTGHFGGRLQKVTGSAAAERFTGPQIMKFAQTEPEAWQNTRHVHLVSSFLCSVLCGKNAPVDFGDGAGMNLLNLQNLRWDNDIAGFTAPDLLSKLPLLAPPGTIAGTLSPYFRKYGFADRVPVAAWSGDNPCSLVGTGCAEAGIIGISLGTSDTMFAPMREYQTDPAGYGHVFGNPAGGFMTLICFANGSLAREKVRGEFHLSREEWETAICTTTPGSGRIHLPYFGPECTPAISNFCPLCNFDRAADPAATVRALLETQILSMKHHSQWMQLDVKKIRLTGGASKSAGLCRIIADVFQADAELLESSNAAGLGAAMIAASAAGKIPFAELASIFCRPVKTVPPNAENRAGYEKQMGEFLSVLKNCRTAKK